MGFFNTSKLKSVSGPQRSCLACGLFRKCKSPKMDSDGLGKKDILIVGSAPDPYSDKVNKPLTGEQYYILKDTLKKEGISLYDDCRITNSINCYSPLRIPTPIQIEACRSRVQALYKKHKPKLIILMGTEAIFSHWGHRWAGSTETISTWRGWNIPDHHFNAWVCPIYGPWILDAETATPGTSAIWINDIQNALSKLEEPLPDRIDENSVDIILDEKQAVSYLKDLISNPPEYLCWDYETTGLKPHHKDHKIICVGIKTEKGQATAFTTTRKVSHCLKKVLLGPSKKIAQNIKFELTWSKFILGIDVHNCFFDPMLASHILDNRPGSTGLKYQSFVQFGVVDYSSHLSHHLRSIDNTANGINNIHKIPVRELLIYCAMDALLEYELSMQQMKQMEII